VVRRNRITATDSKILMPYIEGGVVKNIKTRLPGKDFRLVGGAEIIPYGIDDADETTVWVEGELDKLAIESSGITACIASPSAPPADAKNYNLSYLDRRTFPDVEKFILAGDMDAPGRRLMKELSRRLGVERCWMVEWPEGCKDANDVLKKYGADKINECLAMATPTPVEGLYSPNDYAVEVAELYARGLVKGISTGFETLDPHFTLMGNQWTVVTGAPGSGKSQLIDAFILQTAQKHDWKWGVCSMENQPTELHLTKLIESHNGMPFFNGPSRRLSVEDMQISMAWLQEHISFILPGDNLSVDNILKLAVVEVKRNGINGLVIDPWNELDHQYQGESETQYISKALSKIRRFARKYNLHIFIVAHPTKLRKDDNGKYPVPTPYDISGSAHWYNKADNAISCWRDIQSTTVDVHVQKVRFQKQVGTPGMVSFNYNVITGRYEQNTFKSLDNKTAPWAGYDN